MELQYKNIQTILIMAHNSLIYRERRQNSEFDQLDFHFRFYHPPFKMRPIQPFPSSELTEEKNSLAK